MINKGQMSMVVLIDHTYTPLKTSSTVDCMNEYKKKMTADAYMTDVLILLNIMPFFNPFIMFMMKQMTAAVSISVLTM